MIFEKEREEYMYKIIIDSENEKMDYKDSLCLNMNTK